MTVQTATQQHLTTFAEAAQIYQDAAQVHNLWMGAQDPGIHLCRGEVVENDSPGAGRPDDESIEPFVALSGHAVLRKVLHLEEAHTEGAQLAFIAREQSGHQATLRFSVNGHQILRPPSPVATPGARQYWDMTVGDWSWSRWYYVEIPPELLQPGDNEITVDVVDGEPGWELMVADYRNFYKGMLDPVDLPHTSSISQDNGQIWNPERGEYVLRLTLDRFRLQGELVSPIVDAAGDEEGAIKQPRQVQEVCLNWETETPESTRIRFWVRTGTCSAHDPEHWSAWQPHQSGEIVEQVQGRYLQWKAELESEDPCRTPVLLSSRLEASVQEEEAPPLRLVRAQNARIVPSSRDFEDEDFHCEMLRELRSRFELDAVVAGAQTEFEQIEKLMEWAYYMPLHNCTHFPWNVLDWLQLERDEEGAIKMNHYEQRRRDVMCLYPNVVLVAACLSMGFPARHVNFHSEGMTGHEIAEVWSNDYGKWVHLDATRDYYWYDPDTRVPLDTLEIHQVLVARLERVERWDRPYLFHQDLEALVQDLPIVFREGEHPFSTEEGALFLFRSFCHFRMVPRYNVFSQERPLPVSQGTEVWAWNGYLNWADDQVPPLPHFSLHTNRRADFYPTLNQTRYTIERTDDSMELQVSLETRTSNFDCFLTRIDQGAWQQQPARFRWELHSGVNVLQVRSRNSAGVEGVTSAVAVEA